MRRFVPTNLLPYLLRLSNRVQTWAIKHTSTEKVFTEIYQKNAWGGQPGEYCSGSGTISSTIAEPYVAYLRNLSEELHFDEMRAVDLGCGDMRIGKKICRFFASYVGVDIVKGLIEHHQTSSTTQNIMFEHLNIIEDELPPGDICLIRQVLQHLSNEQILRILPKLSRYKYVFITEHLPKSDSNIVENLDIPHGGDTRLSRNSGVFLTSPPFCLPKNSLETVLEREDHEGVITTMLYRPTTNPSVSI